VHLIIAYFKPCLEFFLESREPVFLHPFLKSNSGSWLYIYSVFSVFFFLLTNGFVLKSDFELYALFRQHMHLPSASFYTYFVIMDNSCVSYCVSVTKWTLCLLFITDWILMLSCKFLHQYFNNFIQCCTVWLTRVSVWKSRVTNVSILTSLFLPLHHWCKLVLQFRIRLIT